MLQWSEKFETGQSLIDAQHRMLVSYINRIEALSGHANPDRQDMELFLRFIEFLEGYILAHFQAEEDCMHRHRCPAHFENKRAHTEFVDFFRQFKRQLVVEGCRPELVKELYDVCSVWIQGHILRVDMQIKPCLDHPPASAGTVGN
jgi:hemerythrin